MRNILKFTIISQRWQKALDEWAEDKRGIAAVEFAMIALPFFILLFGTLEISLIFIVSTTLEHGITEASRQIRTGSAQSANLSEAAYRNALCGEFFGILRCDESLAIDVRPLDGFGAPAPPARDGDGNVNAGSFIFDPGESGDIVLARAFYELELNTPILSSAFVNLGDNSRLIQVGIAFRNEPF